MRKDHFLETIVPMMFCAAIRFVIGIISVIFVIIVPPLGLAVLVIFNLIVWRDSRVSRQRSFLLMLSAAIERGIPLIPALESFGEEYSGWRGRARRLADALANGIPLIDALRLFGGFVPSESLPLIQAGHRSGRLAAALKRVAEQGDRSGPVWQSVALRVFYLVCVLIWCMLIWVFIAIKILPAFEKIFADFGMDLPPMTQTLFAFGDFAYNFAAVLLLPVALVTFFLFCYVTLCYLGIIMFDLPGLRWIVRRLDTATVLDTLAFTTEASQPMPGALAAMASEYPRKSVRRRLRFAWLGVAEGGDWCDSLLANRLMGPADAGVLRAAARADNLPWAMHEMADSNRRRFAYRLQAVVQVLSPIVLVGVGLTIGFFVIACFLPLVKLIECLS